MKMPGVGVPDVAELMLMSYSVTFTMLYICVGFSVFVSPTNILSSWVCVLWNLKVYNAHEHLWTIILDLAGIF